MIKTFKDKATAALFQGLPTRKIPVDLLKRAKEKLDMIDTATTIDQLRVPPANCLEPLKGDRKGQWSIRINRQWRICFVWEDGHAYDVEIADYHKEKTMAIKREDLKNIDFSDVADLDKGLLLPTRPGNILLHDFMEPLGMSANALAKALNVPTNRITSIINGDRAMTADTALRLERYFGMDAEFWLNLQNQYELETARRDLKDRILAEVNPRAA